MDHDQRFKTLLEEFFEQVLRLFFPAWADRLDFASVEWLRQEVFVDIAGFCFVNAWMPTPRKGSRSDRYSNANCSRQLILESEP